MRFLENQPSRVASSCAQRGLTGQDWSAHGWKVMASTNTRGDHVYFNQKEKAKQNRQEQHTGSWLRDPNRGVQREGPVGFDAVFMKHSKIYHTMWVCTLTVQMIKQGESLISVSWKEHNLNINIQEFLLTRRGQHVQGTASMWWYLVIPKGCSLEVSCMRLPADTKALHSEAVFPRLHHFVTLG